MRAMVWGLVFEYFKYLIILCSGNNNNIYIISLWIIISKNMEWKKAVRTLKGFRNFLFPPHKKYHYKKDDFSENVIFILLEISAC